MNTPPEYFERIREGASKRWNQLEQDPELAGPWHQLFKQVQIPRHVLSELLQNADDAGADFASVQIENGVFIFRHNGEDFTDEHFASLCRFGYSNKRALHTIGFRGIGFKSTFSLGDRVELYTQTLSIAFNKHRFTEPIWFDIPLRNDDLTKVQVKIKDEHRQIEIEKNLKEWLDSPVSLLFFKNIRHINILDEEVKWRIIGPGPVKDTELMGLTNKNEKSYLIVKSQFEDFPIDALAEIRDERMFTSDDHVEYPPCQVEIVVGANGRLFVVLPTGVKTSLPFACNAPFIQDPARLKIKDPETSPTNRWLLGRIGKLAALVFLEWLKKDAIGIANRSIAYGVLPEVESDDNSLEGMCTVIVAENFNSIIENENYLLTDEGDLEPANQSVIIPTEIIDVWPAKQTAALLDDLDRPALTNHVSEANRGKLLDRKVITEIPKNQIGHTLRTKQLPKTENWYQLLNLWAYVASEFTSDYAGMHIVPVKGEDKLYAAKNVVRLGKEKVLQSDEDWKFLSEYLLIMDNDFIHFLDEQPQVLGDELRKKINLLRTVLKTMKLDTSDKATRVIDVAATHFFGRGEVSISECVQLTQIAAKLRATIGNSFLYITVDEKPRPIENTVLFDDDGTLEQILPHNWSSGHLLHSDYFKNYKSCTRDDWISWISSNHAGLSTFVPIVQKNESVLGREKIKAEMRDRGFKGEPSFHYVTNHFVIDDWDFEEVHWKHWNILAKENKDIWVQISKCILSQQASFLSKTKNVRFFQKSQQGNKKEITSYPLLPVWVMKLRKLPCLPDTHGFFRKPSEIFRRTSKTESLLEVEPFIDFRYDNESTRDFLTLLGVCDTPTGPDRLLDHLRALSKANNPPIHEVDKWYQLLDRMLDSCSTEDSVKIKCVFKDEKLILAESDNWRRVSEVFLSADEEDVPGAEIIRPSVKDLNIWGRIGVNEQPTADLVIKWLKQLPTGQMSKDDLSRVRKILPRHALRIWNECGHWLNLAGEWMPIENIEYSISMHSLIKWSHLHEWVKQKTADFQRLSGELLQVSPFSEVFTLANQIENRFHQDPSFISSSVKREWLNCFGENICRIKLDDEDNTSWIRSLAADLAETMWQESPDLETIPYIDGKPAGTPTNVDVIWLNRILYFGNIPNAKLARQVPDNLGKMFNNPDITAALNYCFGRTPKDITEYLEENFELVEKEEAKEPEGETKEQEKGTEEPEWETKGQEEGTEEPEWETKGQEEGTEEPEWETKGQEEGTEEPEWETKGQEAGTEEPEWETKGQEEGTEEPEWETKGQEEETTKIHHPPKPTKKDIMERFALSRGYQKREDNHFIHSNGNKICKSSNGSIFPWEKLSSAGEVICYYLPRDHCLEREPLQIEADVWAMVDKSPDTCAFILSDIEDKPVEYSGKHLRSMREEGMITLYPATYRIVYKNDT